VIFTTNTTSTDCLREAIRNNRQFIDYLEEVMMWTLRPPNIDTATMTGMIHDMTPSTLSANVCGRRRKRVPIYPIMFKMHCKYVYVV
jgi:hypothetical protein